MRPQGGGKEATTTRYRKVKRVGHPLAHADGAVYTHRLVLFEKIGHGSHPCHWCGCLVRWKHTLIADHVDGDTWNNKPTNLVASCDACNHSRTQRAVKHCKRGHELTEENIYRRREGGRGCRRCIRMRWKRWWRKNRRRS